MGYRIVTDRNAKSAKANPNGERRDYGVEGSAGLQLRVSATTKHWSLLCRRRGKQTRLPIGEYPAVSLAEARKLAAVKRNTDSATTDARKPLPDLLTFQMLADQWICRYAKLNRRSWIEAERMLVKNVCPAIGAIPVNLITRRDVINCAQVVLDRGAPILANRTQTLIGTIFRWAISEDYISNNPTFGLRKRTSEPSRDRVLNAEEIRRFWRGLDDDLLHESIADTLRLCLLTGQRSGEVYRAKKSEFENDVWQIPAEHTKNERPHRIPLSRATIEIVQRAFDRSPQSQFLFASPVKRDDRPMCKGAVTKAWIRVRPALGLDNTVHDLRRTFASLAGELGFDDFHVGLVLNHIGGRSKITSIYNRAQYEQNKRDVVEAVTRRIFEIVENRETPPDAKAGVSLSVIAQSP